MTGPAVLEVEDLVVHFPLRTNPVAAVGRAIARAVRGYGEAEDERLVRPRVHAVDGVSFAVGQGEIVGLVGESGCGKTTTGRAVLRLVEPTSGTIRFQGQDITRIPEKELRSLRPKMQIVFQDPHAALNPAMTIGQAIMDALLLHVTEDAKEAKDAALRVMEEVGLTPAADLFTKYPADLSGGQKQRAVLARAIVLRPSLIVADEPVAMLDMSIRAKILEILLELRRKYGLAYLFITHDLATAKFVCDQIAIMYLGRIVETGPTAAIFRDPKHPYTRALLAAIPVPEPGRVRERTLPHGEVPDAIFPPAGCRFHPRCPVALPTCGWEGRDFVDYLEERRLDPRKAQADEAALGSLEAWRSATGLAWRRGRAEKTERLVARLRQAAIGAPPAMRDAIQAVKRVGERTVVRFRPPETEGLLARLRVAAIEAPPAMRDAIEEVEWTGDRVVVRFRPPEPLRPKDIEGRTVECLLY